jgi:excisionase family DNA binding protein
MQFNEKRFGSNHKKLLTRKETADLLGVSCGTLAVWVSCKRYPLPYIKVGRLVKYDYNDVLQFLETRRQSGTSFVNL